MVPAMGSYVYSSDKALLRQIMGHYRQLSQEVSGHIAWSFDPPTELTEAQEKKLRCIIGLIIEYANSYESEGVAFKEEIGTDMLRKTAQFLKRLEKQKRISASGLLRRKVRDYRRKALTELRQQRGRGAKVQIKNNKRGNMTFLRQQYESQVDGLIDKELKDRGLYSEDSPNHGLKAAIGIEITFEMRKSLPSAHMGTQEAQEHLNALCAIGHAYRKKYENSAVLVPALDVEAFKADALKQSAIHMIEQLAGYACTVDKDVKLGMQVDIIKDLKRKEAGMLEYRAYDDVMHGLEARRVAILKMRRAAQNRQAVRSA